MALVSGNLPRALMESRQGDGMQNEEPWQHLIQTVLTHHKEVYSRQLVKLSILGAEPLGVPWRLIGRSVIQTCNSCVGEMGWQLARESCWGEHIQFELRH